MCGITGILGKDASQERVSSMAQAIRHRGPDNLTVHTGNDIAFGHARLSIIDLSELGNQPMFSDDKSCWIVHNGEIYNFKALRAELEQQGVRFNTQTDTEVILKLYQSSPDDKTFLNKLDGIFAFAIWDERKNRLLLARDHFGVKPLHYCSDGRNFIFSSEIKSLLASDLYTAKVNHQALHDSLNLRYIPGVDTLFDGVKRLQPGCYLSIEKTSLRPVEQRYYDLADQVTSPLTLSLDEIVDGITSGLRNAVESQLVADVDVGVYLSGGLDSSSLLAHNAQLRGNGVPTFTLDFHSEVDEVPDAALLASHYQTDHHVFDVTADPLTAMERVIWHIEEPKINALQGYLLAQHTARHVKVVHGGLGGDELFAGYQYHRYLAQLSGIHQLLSPLGGLLRALGNGIYAMQSRLLPMSWDERRRGIEMGLSVGDPVAAYLIPRNAWDLHTANWRQIYANDYGHKKLAPVRRHFDPLFAQRDGSLLEKALWAEFHTKLVNDLMLNDDRVSMAHGLELRVPMLDKQLVEFAFSIPAALKTKKNSTKYLLKLASQKLLPPQILNKPKAGFQFNAVSQFQHGLREKVEQRLTRQRVDELGIFNYQYIKKILAAKPSPQLRWHYFLLWQMLGFDIWHQLFIENDQSCHSKLNN